LWRDAGDPKRGMAQLQKIYCWSLKESPKTTDGNEPQSKNQAGLMKRVFGIGIICGILSSVGWVHATTVFEITLMPSFHPVAVVTITRTVDKTTAIFRIVSALSKTEYIENYDFFDKKATDEFFSSINKLAGEPPGDPRPPLFTDGIVIAGKYTRPDVPPFVFRSWSPSERYHQRDLAIIQALFRLLDPIQTSQGLMEYLEDVGGYFKGLRAMPVKIIGGYPYRIRFYGGLGKECAPQLKELLQNLPKDRPLLIDMSYLHDINESLYPYFRDLIKKNKEIEWIATGRAKFQLWEMGVEEEKIVTE
jgi:hypothetical protein